MPLKMGIDLGGTKIEGVVLDGDGGVLFRERIPTGQEKGYEHILANIRKIYELMCSRFSAEPHTLGIGTPGAISRVSGRLKNSNTLCLNNRLSAADLEACLGRSVAVANDANCFALAEALLGAGRGKRMVFGVIMGTGCGGGIVYDGRLVSGLQGIAGEWGHMAIDPAGPLCYCGSRGCVETFISGGGLENRYAAVTGEKLSLKEIVSAFRREEPRAVEFMETFFTHFGRSLANLINILDPDVVVLGGGVSNIDEIYSEGVAQVRKMIFNDTLTTPVVKHTLGDSAGVLGAALMGAEAVTA